MNPKQGVEVDPRFTLRATFTGLAIGIIIAMVVGFLLLKLSQPLTLDNGQVTWRAGAFMLPLAALIATGILAWSVFHVPVVMARRRGVVLDPSLWPATGAIAIGVIVVIGFVLAMLTGQI